MTDKEVDVLLVGYIQLSQRMMLLEATRQGAIEELAGRGICREEVLAAIERLNAKGDVQLMPDDGLVWLPAGHPKLPVSS